ncbi:MAG: NUDIX hydrolase [Actinomycetota bacterium]|nr:NUDIX hydrolase [Actinomycetota bacterium]
MIRAAGGVVTRAAEAGLEVLLVHRPKYGDWSLPKGKARRFERDKACALREVEEETGLRCELGEELATTRYDDVRGRTKRVRYWLMTPIAGTLEFTNEVDDGRWLSVEEARDLLSYERDVRVLGCLDARADATPT